MALFPDWLYKLTPRDEQVTPLEIINTWAQNDLTVDQYTRAYTVPEGKILLLTGFTWRIQTDYTGILDPEVGLDDVSVLGQNTLLHISGLSGLDQYVTYNQTGEWIIPPGKTIVGTATISGMAGTFASSALTIWGLLIPRGNFAV